MWAHFWGAYARSGYNWMSDNECETFFLKDFGVKEEISNVLNFFSLWNFVILGLNFIFGYSIDLGGRHDNFFWIFLNLLESFRISSFIRKLKSIWIFLNLFESFWVSMSLLKSRWPIFHNNHSNRMKSFWVFLNLSESLSLVSAPSNLPIDIDCNLKNERKQSWVRK